MKETGNSITWLVSKCHSRARTPQALRCDSVPQLRPTELLPEAKKFTIVVNHIITERPLGDRELYIPGRSY